MSDEDVVQDKRDDRRNAEETYVRDVTKIMQTPGGRRVFWRIIRGTGFWEGLLASPEHQTTLVARRSVGVHLWNDLRRVCPTEHRLMVNEHLNLEDRKK